MHKLKHMHSHGHMEAEGRGPRGGKARGRGRGRGGNRPAPPAVSHQDLAAWFAGSLPDDWYLEPVSVVFDRDEILVTGQLAAPRTDGDASQSVAEQARIEQHREATREQRMAVASRAQEKFGRIVSWAAVCGETSQSFTTASVPAMTRLQIEERQTLDTLIDAGVARSRSDALAWCVRLVGENESEWIGDLRSALEAVESARNNGPV